MAIVDSGAATNIMTSKLQKELNVRIIDKSKTVFTIANGEKVAALGKAVIEMEIGEKVMNVEVQIIESKKRDFILGTKLFAETKGNIDFENKRLWLIIEGKEVSVPIYFEKQRKDVRIGENNNEENNENEENEYEENEYESNEEQELYEEDSEEGDNENDNEENEMYDKSSAYYLAELL
jgi:Aspartyl protease